MNKIRYLYFAKHNPRSDGYINCNITVCRANNKHVYLHPSEASVRRVNTIMRDLGWYFRVFMDDCAMSLHFTK